MSMGVRRWAWTLVSMNDIEPIASWVIFRSFPDESAELALCGQLQIGR
jgi:hypothetical protein